MLSQWIDGAGADYHDAVWRAVVDTRSRAVFRRDRNLTDVFGVAYHLGRGYLEAVDDRAILEIIADSQSADKIGAPITYDYGDLQLCPNTLRYGKVLQDFTRLFPNYASFETIAEIGIGYGGQARIVSEHARKCATRLQCYSLIDLLPVCLLAQSFLDNFPMVPNCSFLTKSQLPRDGRWDFVVSNYALSEFDVDLGREYLDRVVAKSRSGYLTMNSGLGGSGLWRQAALAVETFLAELPNAVLLSEEPVTHHANNIIVFGDHAAGSGVSLGEMRDRALREIERHQRFLEIAEAERLADDIRRQDSSPKDGVRAAGPRRAAKRHRPGWFGRRRP